MENNRAHEIIVEVLQTALTGKLSANVNLHDIANAIAAKVEFEKSYTNFKKDKVVGELIDAIVVNSDDMNTELDKLDEEETLLQNFIQGKLTAYAEMLSIIKKL
jgi:vacuolar-type H+-ATPase subunit I/STV1